MGRILIVAEKPSVARDYAKVLGCRKKGNGYIEGDDYVITWAIGHLISLAEPHHYDKRYKTWRQEDLPIQPEIIKLRVDRKKSSQYNIIKDYMNSPDIDYIICGTDSGREGELIFRYIYDHAKCKKEVKRLWISSMTDVAIREGFDNLKDGKEYDTLYDSAKCRSEADWLVGMNGSRSFSIKYNSLLSIGRVQTPTLAIIVERHLAIENFNPQDYFELEVDFGAYKGTWIDKDKKSKIESYDNATALMQKVHKGEGTVISCKKKSNKTSPPLPYDLTELQRDANKKFGYSAKKTLGIAQDLYEKKKAITYPRTDSRYITKDLKQIFIKRVQRLNIEPYKGLVEQITDFTPKRKIVNDSKVTDHHAIILTDKQPALQSLSKEEFNVYNMIVARMIELFYPQYVEENTELVTDVREEKFLTKGKRVVDMGFKKVGQILLKNKSKEDKLLPEIHEGDKFFVENATIHKKKTQPPKPYTEASLLSAMEHAGKFVEDEAIKDKLKEMGLGTPATRAGIIERLIRVEYIKRKGKTLIPTEKGVKLISVLPHELKSPEMTGKWERALKRIHEGTMAPDKFMASIGRYVNYIVTYVKNDTTAIQFPESKKGKRSKKKNLGQCPLCKKGNVFENSKAYFCGEWKNGCKFTTWKNAIEPYGISIDEQVMRKLVAEGMISNTELYLPQTHEKCTGDIKLNPEGHVEFVNIKRVLQNAK